MRIMFLAVTMLALASGLEAQAGAREYSLIYGRNISQANLAKAVRECDQKVLRPPCGEVIRKSVDLGFIGADAAKVVHKDSLRQLAPQLGDYIASLTERPCPAGAKTVSTEWAPNEKVLFVSSHTMNCTTGEKLLWHDERPVISLYDGNLIASYSAPTQRVASAASAETTQAGATRNPAAAVVDTPTTPRRTAVPDQRIPVNKPAVRPVVPRAVPSARVDTVTRLLVRTDTVKVNTRTVTEVRKGPRVWPWVVGGVLAVGGGIATYCIIEGCGGRNVNTNTNINNGMVAMRRGGFSFSIGR